MDSLSFVLFSVESTGQTITWPVESASLKAVRHLFFSRKRVPVRDWAHPEAVQLHRHLKFEACFFKNTQTTGKKLLYEVFTHHGCFSTPSHPGHFL